MIKTMMAGACALATLAAGAETMATADFTIQVEQGFHDTPLTESYYYGSGFSGNFGYVDNYRRSVAFLVTFEL